MPIVTELEPGVMFWAGGDPAATVREWKSLGFRCGQLGMPGGAAIDLAAAAQWRNVLEAEDFSIFTVFAAYEGEDYADIPTVQRTVGWIPRATRAQRLHRTFQLSDFARALGVPSVALHVGFVPEDHTDGDYIAVREMTRLVCQYAAANGQSFALETGQEAAGVLVKFLEDAACPNLGINFDPANMILYGTGDPIEALGVLGRWVLSVHAKDGDWPAKDVPGALGTERRLGDGEVGIERFLGKLREVGYRSPLFIEREVPDHAAKLADVAHGAELLRAKR